MTTERTEVVERIRAAMEDEGRSMKWTANAAGIAYTTFQRKMNPNGPDFTMAEVGNIARSLRVAPASLFPSTFKEAVA